MNRHIEELIKLLGEDKVSTDPITIKLYSKNAVYYEGSALAVVFPESTVDVSKLARYAYENDLKIYPQGSASEIVGSSTPREDGIVVNFMRMRKIKEINYVDSYVVAEPGVRLIELNNVLRRDGYMFPIDPASIKSATVGGAINSGSGGMMGAKYGTMKDWVLGLEVVLPDEDGTVLRLGGKTTKNREGYDLIRLIVGSEGTLALVTESTLRITLAPERVVTVAGFFGDLEDLMACVVEIKKSKLDVLIMEFVDDATAKMTVETLGSKVVGEGHLLITSVSTVDEAAERVRDALVHIYDEAGANKIYSALTMEEAEDMGIFDIRRNLYPASIKMASLGLRDDEEKPYIFVEDISVPPTKLVEAVRRLRNISDKYGFPMVLGGHVGDGNLHPVVWIRESERDKMEQFNKFVLDIMEMAIELGGVISSEHGIGTVKKDGLIMSFRSKNSLKALRLMHEIKKIFDPKNILNPDKMLPSV